MPDASTHSFLLLPATFDIHSPSSASALAVTLEPVTTQLAQNKSLRERLGNDDTLWNHLQKLWHDLSRAQLTFWDNDDSDDEDNAAEQEKQKQASLRMLSASLARFTRNLVAGVPHNQAKAFETEPSIRRLLHYYTSWSFLEDPEGRHCPEEPADLKPRQPFLLAAFYLRRWQILSLETMRSSPNSGAHTCVFQRIKSCSCARLLASPDPRTLLAALILILNCVEGSRPRIKMLTRTVIGVRICICLLDNMVKLYEAEEGTDEARAFDIGYTIFSKIMGVDLVPSLFNRLEVADEIITPHQTTLLKLIDSYLQSASMSQVPTTPQGTPLYSKLRPMLSKTFFVLSEYAQTSIRTSLNLGKGTPTTTNSESSLGSLDVMLPKACEALVLVTQCIVTVILGGAGMEQPSQEYFNEAKSGDTGILESLTELLRLLDLFLPRINFGKPVTDPGRTQPTSVGVGDANSKAHVNDTGFNYLKRDLVRLLGILCHENKAVQDRARLCGGIEAVMNLCVVDERNPYLREHAILALHNLLQGNPENQAVVDSIQPSGKWDDNGVYRQTAGAVRK
ncbi:Ataxin-10-like protein [Mycena kentingensis (nom. inval.)]|nr:Ataxin-10-like protein [Mycena kentingensis (nom. inval.)]